MVAIETHDLTKQYGTVLAVDDLSLSIPEGVVYGVLGPNGDGKTTMMRMLTTLTKPTSGSARVMGDPITDRLALVEHIGYLPEEPPLFDELSGHEQLDYIRGLRDLPLEPTQERIESLVDALDLEDYIDRRIATYSKGTRQKLAFVQILLHGPDVLFLDEPTEGLDPRAARTLRTMIDDLADEGTTIILSSHILPIVEEHADIVGVISNGQLVAEGAPSELQRRAETGKKRSLEDVFLEVTQELPDATQGPEDESGNHDE